MEKTAVKEVLDIVQMDYNNGVEISRAIVLKMLEKALEKEKKQIVKVFVDITKNTLDGLNVPYSFKDIIDFTEIAKDYYDEEFQK